MKLVSAILFLPLIFLCAVSNFAQGSQIVYDPANDEPYKSPAAELDFVKSFVLPAVKNIWNESVCTENINIAGRAEGSFTKPKTKQTAYLFEYCETGNGIANDGILIAENQTPTALYVFDGGLPLGFSKLADINRNRLDEMVIQWAGGMHQGQIVTAAVVLETTPVNLRELGAMQSSWSVCDGETSTLKCGYAYKITAAPAIRPIFYQLKMVGEGKTWRAAGKAQKANFFKTTAKYQKINQ